MLQALFLHDVLMFFGHWEKTLSKIIKKSPAGWWFEPF
jgi:hypothetical protein